MITLEIKRNRQSLYGTVIAKYTEYAFIHEKTMTVCHYSENLTSEQLDQAMSLLQKTIDSIYDMTFTPVQRNLFKGIRGENDCVHINIIDDGLKWVGIFPHPTNLLLDFYIISCDDFKKLLVAQHKENELSYLLLKGAAL